MRRTLLALVATITVLPAVAWAGYPYDDDDDADYVDPQQGQTAVPPPPPANGDPQQQQMPPQGYEQQQAPPQGYDQQQPPPQAVEAGQPVDPSQYSVGYFGPHPLPYEQGNGFCYTEGAHTHEYAPFDEHLFRQANGYYYFVGDPVDFGWNRTVYWFNGNHPIPLAYGGGYCYITWPHRHSYEPGGISGFSFVGGYWAFNGPWPSDYWYYRSYYWGYYGGYYRNWYYGNRYYSLRPTAAYRVGAPYRVAAPAGRSFVGVAAPRAYAPAGMTRVGAPGYNGVHSTIGAPRPAAIGAPRPMAVGAPGAYGHPGYAAPSPARPTYTAAPRYAPPSGFRSPAAAPSYHPAPSSSSFHSSPSPSFHSSGGGGGGFRRR